MTKFLKAIMRSIMCNFGYHRIDEEGICDKCERQQTWGGT